MSSGSRNVICFLASRRLARRCVNCVVSSMSVLICVAPDVFKFCEFRPCRALSATNLDKYYHIPYRTSKLTLLLKNAFELESHRHCKTVFIACVSPSVADMSMTMNTLRYLAPFKVGELKEKTKPNPDNPANWSNDVLRAWVTTRSSGAINPDLLCPYESGMQGRNDSQKLVIGHSRSFNSIGFF